MFAKVVSLITLETIYVDDIINLGGLREIRSVVYLFAQYCVMKAPTANK